MLYGKNTCKKIGPDGKDNEPAAHEEQNETTPLFHLLCAGFQGLHDPLLRRANEKGQREHEQGHSHRRQDEGSEGGFSPTNGQCVSGQTGQDGTCSTEAGQNVTKSEETKGQCWSLAAQACLGLHQRVSQPVNSTTPR